MAFAACSNPDSATIVLQDFNESTFGNWEKTGTAFETGPVKTKNQYHLPGSLGPGFASSSNPMDDAATGTLTSPPFEIERNSIHFLIGSREIDYLNDTAAFRKGLSIELLIGGEVVRSQSPDEFHALFWRSWDVSDFKGRQARIRIVDQDDRPDSHINIDQIVHNDLPPEGLPIEKTITVDQPLLNFPVQENGERFYLELWHGGEQIRAMDVALAKGKPDYWVVTDLSPWTGEKITIRTKQRSGLYPKLLDEIRPADHILEAEDLYQEPLRPQFHFSSKRGWINDPNGLVYYDGEFHLYYQHNPYGWDHSRNDYNKTWGHAVSKDLVYWEELPAAIHPDHLGPIYSGSAVVDHNNTTGFRSGAEKPIVAIYTSAGGRSPWSSGKKFTQSIAYSNDRGRTFKPHEGNPVQPNLDYINRDPKVIWHEPSDQWVIVLHLDEKAMAFFTSSDLKSWDYQSRLESDVMIDCPELFQLPLDGDTSRKKWILYGGSGDYLIGEFDGQQFKPQSDYLPFNQGNAFYASQTFNNMPDTDPRRIQVAWGWVETEGMPFNQQLLFPVELTLRQTPQGLRIYAFPVREIETLRKKTHDWKDVELQPGVNDILSGVEGGLFDVEAEFEAGDAESFGITANGISITFEPESNRLICGDREVGLSPVSGKIRLRLLVDRLTVEIFANDGRIYMPMEAIAGAKEKGLQLFSKRGRCRINDLKIHELKSIWPHQKQ